MALFRDGASAPRALLDRCPHRNVPLTEGSVRDGELECFYHGWRFDGSGRCRAIPGLGPERAAELGHKVVAFPVREQDGFLWVWADAATEPARPPYRFEYLNAPGYVSVQHVAETEGALDQVAENALDVPHTAYLHGGLFRKRGREQPIEVIIRRSHDRVEAEYAGEPPPTGLAGRLLALGGEKIEAVEHFDRFLLPSVVEVEYRLGAGTHFVSIAALSPVDDKRTKLFATVSVRLPISPGVLTRLVRPVALQIFGQDARALGLQQRNVERFGGAEYVSTELDVLGAHILRLLRNAARGEREPFGPPTERRLTIVV